MKSLVFVLCFLFFKSSCYGAVQKSDWPTNLKICNISLPKSDFNECIRDGLEFFITAPHDEKTSVKIPIFDPFTVNTLSFQLNFNVQMFTGGELKVKNLKNRGFSKLKVQKVKANFTEETLDLLAKILIPEIQLNSLYKTNFALGSANVNSKGHLNVTGKDIFIKVAIKGKVQEVSGEKFMKIEKFDMNPYDIKDLKISITGLFKEPELNHVANDFLNTNWRSLRGTLVNNLNKQWEILLLGYSNDIFAQIPWNQLYEK